MHDNPTIDIAVRCGAHPQHFWLRGEEPSQTVRFDEAAGKWDVFGHAEALRVLNDTATFSSDTKRLYTSESVNTHKSGNLIQMDEPEHRTMRALVSRAFTPKIVADLEPRIHDLTHELVDEMTAGDRIELMTDLAYPLPVIVIAELLGVPPEDRGLFKKWTSVMLETTAQLSLTDDDEQIERDGSELLARWEPMFDYIRDHVAQRRRSPREDLMTQLVAAELDGRRLTDDEVVTFAVLLLVGGHVSTTMLLGSTLLCLDAHPEWERRVRDDRSWVQPVLEESIRLFSPFPAVGRSTLTETEIAGHRLGPDEMVMVWSAAANRDPLRFPRPHEFDPTREQVPHLSYGRGIHFCMGAPLARLEGRIALNILLDRLPPLRTVEGDPPVFIESPDMTGVRTLPLRAAGPSVLRMEKGERR